MTDAAGASVGRRTLRIGITGPIGCGKSQVARWLADLGVSVVDADALARAVTAPGEPAHDAVLARFGPGVAAPDGTLDRKALGRLVFGDPARLAELEAIVHPAVRRLVLDALGHAEGEGALAVVVEAIKLVEGGLASLCDEVWLIACDPAVQFERLLGRGSTREEARQRISAQAGLADRVRSAATRVLDTSGPEATTRAAVAAALEAALAGRR